MDICPNCQTLVPEGSAYCPKCGKALHEEAVPMSTTLLKQLTIYTISFFLPPFGLWWSFKYLKQQGEIYKKIGWISIALTILAIILNLYFIMFIFGSLSSQMSMLDNGF
ncbi:MAG: zinc ribbon domain-containing protein [bacterium]|nr:zinc ribbon domain-containing protein [bacterium]